MTWFRQLAKRVSSALPAPVDLRPELIVDVAIYVVAKCPCGSTHEHHLTLVSQSDCARCGRTIGVRSVQFERTGLAHVTSPRVSVGYVVTADTLRRMTVATVQ